MPQDNLNEPSRLARARSTLGRRRVAMRMIHHPDHGAILVYELDPAPGQRGIPTLIYEYESERSMLDRFPRDWRTLPDDELLALVRAADGVRR